MEVFFTVADVSQRETDLKMIIHWPISISIECLKLNEIFFSRFGSIYAEDEWETLDLIPNIILNPGFFEPDDPDNPSPPYSRTIIFGEDELSSSEDETEEETIPFKRKFSLFFTGDTIKRLWVQRYLACYRYTTVWFCTIFSWYFLSFPFVFLVLKEKKPGKPTKNGGLCIGGLI